MWSRRLFLFGGASLPLLAYEESIASLERRIFEAMNFQRASAGCEPLAWSSDLGSTAREHSRRMLEANFFGHEDPVFGDLATRLNRAAIAWLHCAENVFRERNYENPVDPVALAAVAWMYSEGHRKNVLTPDFTETGVGVGKDAEGRLTFTQQFVTRFPGTLRGVRR